MKKIYISILLASTISFLNAEQITKVEQNNSDLNLTIYNDSVAMVTEQRKVNFKEGKQHIIYENVPSNIIQESVRTKFSNELTLYSQNYSFDTINFNSLLKFYLGKKISYINNSNKKVEAFLLSENPILIKDLETKEIIVINDNEKILFPEIPDSMSLTPSLFWNVYAKKNQENGFIKINYLTNGFNWLSNYTLSINKKSSLNGWITVTNNSGVDYPNANLTFLAGDINLFKKNIYEKQYMATMDLKENSLAATPMAGFTPEINDLEFNGYHLYKIPFKESLKDKETKQISFINKEDLKYKEFGKTKLTTNIFSRSVVPINFDSIIEIENTKENGLGISLPKGLIRVFKEDKDNIEQFIGESEINNISTNDKFSLKIGKLFDIKGEYKIINHETNTSHMYHEKEIKLSNRSNQKIDLKIEDLIQQGNNKVISTNTCEKEKKCIIKDIAKNYREINISLLPNEEYVFNVTYDIIF